MAACAPGSAEGWGAAKAARPRPVANHQSRVFECRAICDQDHGKSVPPGNRGRCGSKASRPLKPLKANIRSDRLTATSSPLRSSRTCSTRGNANPSASPKLVKPRSTATISPAPSVPIQSDPARSTRSVSTGGSLTPASSVCASTRPRSPIRASPRNVPAQRWPFQKARAQEYKLGSPSCVVQTRSTTARRSGSGRVNRKIPRSVPTWIFRSGPSAIAMPLSFSRA